MDFPQHDLNAWVNHFSRIVAALLIPLLILAVAGWIGFRKNRIPRSYDTVLLCMVGVFCTWVYLAIDRNRKIPASIREASLITIWSIVLLGIVAGWFRQNFAGQYVTVRESLLWFIPVSVLFVISEPAFQLPRGGVPTVEGYCKNNLKQIGLALHNYRDMMGKFPLQRAGDPTHSWRVELLPYLDQKLLYNRYDFDSEWDSPANFSVSQTMSLTYECPAVPEPENVEGQRFTAYAIVSGDRAVWQPSGPADFSKITDGISSTAAMVEACGQRIVWTEPRDIDAEDIEIGINIPGDGVGVSPAIFSGYHVEGVNVLMVDGRVRTLPLNTDPEIINAIITTNGGEKVGVDF